MPGKWKDYHVEGPPHGDCWECVSRSVCPFVTYCPRQSAYALADELADAMLTARQKGTPDE
jgi:hypothetical protein